MDIDDVIEMIFHLNWSFEYDAVSQTIILESSNLKIIIYKHENDFGDSIQCHNSSGKMQAFQNIGDLEHYLISKRRAQFLLGEK